MQPSNHPTIQPSNHPTIQPSNHPIIGSISQGTTETFADQCAHRDRVPNSAELKCSCRARSALARASFTASGPWPVPSTEKKRRSLSPIEPKTTFR
ncbi:PT domain-containing protein [Variovorax sp. J22R115]|uniref:PT domain-containing protein n=1 Tax=Variovorax sp. J22R115 TaxID=3053509 RepID=UPI0034E04511